MKINYCFGEGCILMGIYRSKKRGDVTSILELLVAYGATPDILIEASAYWNQ
jgi:hypothetical protein